MLKDLFSGLHNYISTPIGCLNIAILGVMSSVSIIEENILLGVACFILALGFIKEVKFLKIESNCKHSMKDKEYVVFNILIWKGGACIKCTFEEPGTWFPKTKSKI